MMPFSILAISLTIFLRYVFGMSMVMEVLRKYAKLFPLQILEEFLSIFAHGVIGPALPYYVIEQG